MAPAATVSPPTTANQSNGINGTSILNGVTNGNHVEASATPNDILDLLCVGFGPASLATAIALNDAYKSSPTKAPKVLFIEKQARFAWHAGMQLPGAKMQISFLKDLATPRDPTSKFTFLNYLFQNGRLNHFINLGTFLPSRAEYEDYLRWCAGHFEAQGHVAYGVEVEGVRAGEKNQAGKVTDFVVAARDRNGELFTRRARHVVIAVGGRPVIPASLQGLKHVSHSSQFSSTITKIREADIGRPLRFAVIGGGQSAAEIFNDIWTRFPDAEVKLIIKGASLRPSDDSPFVNEIFDPDRVDGIYNQSAQYRAAALALDRGTNYGVVRLELLEHLYEKLYGQRLWNSDESTWSARIIPNRAVVSASQSSNSSVTLRLGDPAGAESADAADELEVDYVFTATGYRRNAHEEMLADSRALLPESQATAEKFPVARDYRVLYDEAKVDGDQAGVWLQGCNEGTHGLSDTLLSILAVRGGELVQSMFGKSKSSNP